ncbi:MAG: helix-turn-helix domain-containing protein [Clostridia bacterium]|nr:helix-turn-helix domain-containing protein [Clostridia bacterium]
MSGQLLTRQKGIGEGRSLSVSEREIFSFPLHTHGYCEIELILFGEGSQEIGGKVIPLKRGSVSILTPTDCHSVESKEGLTILNISFAEELVPKPLRERLYSLASFVGTLDEGELSRLVKLGELLALEGDDLTRVGCLLEYLLMLFPKKEDGGCCDACEAARLYADTHFRESLTVADGARVACLSSVYFVSLFKKRMGISFGAYLSKKRLAFAKALLEGGVGVADACFESGFGSVSNFTAAFHREYGIPPSAARGANSRDQR